MFKYFVKDMTAVLKYIPFGIIASLFVAFVFMLMNKVRAKRGEKLIRVWASTFFIVYVVIMLILTFLSRENGSTHVLDLQLFSTLKINARNNAYVLENILFFVPYGYLLAEVFRPARTAVGSLFFGLATSFFIEWIQYVTGRGVFQIDDILTNVVGAFVGFLIYKLFHLGKKKNM